MENIINLVDFKGSELIFRAGTALEIKAPELLKIKGTIETPLLWLQKKLKSLDLICCHLLINKSSGFIKLITDEKNFYHDEITGSLELHPDFVKWNINSGQSVSAFDLAEKIKMNRSCFKDKETAMKLVKELRNFKAKIDKELETFKDDRANFALKKSQIVDTNLPESFVLVVPIFKGQPKESIMIEININADDLNCSLISPEANDYISDFKDTIIKNQIDLIHELVPELVIIEI
jgi:hypothetical protein